MIESENLLKWGFENFMKQIKVDTYKLDRAPSRMAKEFGTIPNGQEGNYAYPLSAMEGNMLKLHRQDTNRSSRQALIAVRMALLVVDGYIKQVEYDFSGSGTLENQALLHGLLMGFDPFTNKEVHQIVIGEANSFDAQKYFTIPIKCLLRIDRSIKYWTKQLGPTGYFTFIENQMGHLVKPDDVMNFAALTENAEF
ncbi:MAG: hypothetical protein ABF608_09150 [Sporolactobacillus sp.]